MLAKAPSLHGAGACQHRVAVFQPDGSEQALPTPASLAPDFLAPASLAPGALLGQFSWQPTAPSAALSPWAMASVTAVAVTQAAPGFVLGGLWPTVSGTQEASFAAATAAAARPGPLTDDNSDLAVHGATARQLYGVSGAGIRIGILSDSFNVLGGMAADQADGNLPAGVTILQDGPAGSHDEGRAMADLIHRIAPGAQIYFHTATAGEANYAAGIAALVAAGCNVIVDDVAYLDEPFFQDGGAVQAAVEAAVAKGVSYFSAASNEGNDYIQQGFNAVRATLPGLPAGTLVQNFAAKGAAAQPWLAVTIPTGGQIQLDMQWDQPFATIGKGQASANSLGLALYNQAGQLVAAASVDCVGGNPDQTLTYQNLSANSGFRLVVFQNGGGAPPNLFKIINYGSGSISGGGVGSGAVIGQEMVAGANTVGAIAWSGTSTFHGNNAVEPFSSVGTGDILFNAAGQRLATPLLPAKVNFCAPDGSITSVMAPFYGTSAAAPNAAAVAALVLQADPHLTPAQLSSVLAATAAHSVSGEAASGAGLVQADAAVKMALALAHVPGS